MQLNSAGSFHDQSGRWRGSAGIMEPGLVAMAIILLFLLFIVPILPWSLTLPHTTSSNFQDAPAHGKDVWSRCGEVI